MVVLALMLVMDRAITAHVHLVSLVLTASLIIDHVKMILVGTTVTTFCVLDCNLKREYIASLGTCYNVSDTDFNCSCVSGWEGKRCERMINHCDNITCENKGICRPSLLIYTCECLYGYYGQHCETATATLVIYQIVSTSFAYVAIIAMGAVVMFVVVMDILKYCFGIDPVEEEREKMRQQRRAKKRKPIIQRFVYVNATSTSSPEQPTSTTAETTV